MNLKILVLFAVALLSQKTVAGGLTPAAVGEFGRFAAKHKLGCISGHDSVGEPFMAELVSYKTVQDPTTPTLHTQHGEIKLRWEEDGYPTIEGAIKRVESDYFKYPKGHIGKFTK